MTSQTSHQGHVNRRSFSENQGGGGSGIVPYVSLPYENKDNNLQVGDFIKAPGYGFFGPWPNAEQGYYFGTNYILKGMRILFNDFDSIGLNDVTVSIWTKLADGTNPAPTGLLTALLHIPNVGFNGLFLGFYIDIYNIPISAGLFVYGMIHTITGGTYNGINMDLLFEKA